MVGRITADIHLVLCQNDIGAFTVPEDAELETKVNVVLYDNNTNTTKDKGKQE